MRRKLSNNQLITLFSIVYLALILMVSVVVASRAERVETGADASFYETYGVNGTADYCRMTRANLNENPLKTCNPVVGGYLGGLGRVEIGPAVNLNNATVPNPVDTRCSVIQWDGVNDFYVQYSADAWNYCRYEINNDHCYINGVRSPFNSSSLNLLKTQFDAKCVPATPTPTARPTATPPPVPTVTPTRVPTPTPTRIPTPTPSRVPTPTPTRVPSPTPIACTNYTTTTQSHQYRTHKLENGVIKEVKHVNPTVTRKFTITRAQTVPFSAIMQRGPVVTNTTTRATDKSCAPQPNEEAWVTIERKVNNTGIDARDWAYVTNTGLPFFDNSDKDFTSLTDTVTKSSSVWLEPGTYRLKSVWAGDGRLHKLNGQLNPNPYFNFQTPNVKVPYKDTSINNACQWNGSYYIKFRYCILP